MLTTHPDQAYAARPSHELSFDVHVFGITITSWPLFKQAFTIHKIENTDIGKQHHSKIPPYGLRRLQ